jgi:hypothetical protein
MFTLKAHSSIATPTHSDTHDEVSYLHALLRKPTMSGSLFVCRAQPDTLFFRFVAGFNALPTFQSLFAEVSFDTAHLKLFCVHYVCSHSRSPILLQ